MHYELYVDSLFLINFIMNLYLLMLVNRAVLLKAGPCRIGFGAAFGAVCFLLPYFFVGPAVLKLFFGIVAGTVGMLLFTFSVKSLRMFLKLLEKLLLYSFGLGGTMLFLIRFLPGLGKYLTGVAGILGVGGLFFLLFRRLVSGPDMEHSVCRAWLCQDGSRTEVMALVDSGNSLSEPISGKPVCVIGRETYEGFGKKGHFRAIPYHSIGKRKGILPGFLLERLELELEGVKYAFTDVYVAVSEEVISETGNAESVNMIINPSLLWEGGRSGRRKRQNERHNDSESDVTGQDAV